jgi:serine/threonine-protein kinase RsbW
MHVLSTVRLPAKLDNLYKFLEVVSRCAKEQGFTQKRIYDIELAMEEALVNIFNYAYRDNTGDVEVTCFIDNDKRFVMDIIDSGIPFNVLSHKEPDLTSDISERNIGGLGVFLMKKLTDDIKYRRENDKNILSLVVLKNK